MRNHKEKQSVLPFERKAETKDARCPHCQGNVRTARKNMPVWYGMTGSRPFCIAGMKRLFLDFPAIAIEKFEKTALIYIEKLLNIGYNMVEKFIRGD